MSSKAFLNRVIRDLQTTEWPRISKILIVPQKSIDVSVERCSALFFPSLSCSGTEVCVGKWILQKIDTQ